MYLPQEHCLEQNGAEKGPSGNKQAYFPAPDKLRFPSPVIEFLQWERHPHSCLRIKISSSVNGDDLENGSMILLLYSIAQKTET